MRRVIPIYDIDSLTPGGAATARHRFHLLGVTSLVVCVLSYMASARATATRPPNGPETPASTQSVALSQAVLDGRLVAEFRRRADANMALHEKMQQRRAGQKERGDIGENHVLDVMRKRC